MNEPTLLERNELAIPEEPGTEIQVRLGDDSLAIDLTKPALIFREHGGDPILDRIKSKLDELAPTIDISSPKGRTQVNSICRNAGGLLKSINDTKLSYTESIRLVKAAVDKEGKRIADSGKAMIDEFRKPLTEWEQKKEAERAKLELALGEMQNIALIPASSSSEQIREALAKLEAAYRRDWDEFALKAKKSFEHAHAELIAFLEAIIVREAEKAAEQQRKLADQLKAKKEREERIAREAAQKAKAEAEQKAEQERVAVEIAAQRAREDAERALQTRIAAEIEAKRQQELAEKRARDAEAAKVAAEERAKKAAADAKVKAKRDAEAAVQRERERAEAVRQEGLKELAAREADVSHRASIHAKAIHALQAIMAEVPSDALVTAEAMAEFVIKAIADERVPYCTINY